MEVTRAAAAPVVYVCAEKERGRKKKKMDHEPLLLAKPATHSSSSCSSDTGQHESSSIVLLEINEFGRISNMLDSTGLSHSLNRLVCAFDDALHVYRMHRVGLFNGIYTAFATTDKQHANDAVRFALYCLNYADSLLVDSEHFQSGTVSMRAAVHSGPLTTIRLMSSMDGNITLLGATIREATHLLHNDALKVCTGHVRCSGATATRLNLEDFQHLELHASSWNGKESPMAAFCVLPSTGPLQSLMCGACLVCPHSMRLTHHIAPFLSPHTQNIAGRFGFQVHELRQLRMLYGPNTDMSSIVMAIKNAHASMHPTCVPNVALYSRCGEMTVCDLTFQYVPSRLLLAMAVLPPGTAPENEQAASSLSSVMAAQKGIEPP